MSDLATIQQWMQNALLGPYDAEAGTAREMFTASRRLTAEQRFHIYHRGYRLRLLNCMRGLHPGMLHLLGRELFDRFALDYLDAHPSRSPSLARLDDGFADHLERTRPDAGAPEEWVDLLVDLARFERLFTDVLDAPEDDPAPRPFRARSSVHDYLAAVRRGEDPPLPEPHPTSVLLTREEGRVVVRPEWVPHVGPFGRPKGI
ncbi:DNA-binding domain-containing protein [Streptomyces sp. NPDC020799]|uniref:DNA-binding domain-containing protein n=1 Tax=unclassified Streptomyces TaxID=2593676 RepID=UPI00340A8883